MCRKKVPKTNFSLASARTISESENIVGGYNYYGLDSLE
jgi:hypothetical protein